MAVAVDSIVLLLEQIFSDFRVYKVVITNTLLIVGAWYSFRYTCKLGSLTLEIAKCCKRLFSRTNFVRKYGAWAVVTGCTQGIGREFSHILAAKGMNIVLVSRNEAKLKHEARLIESMYGVHAVTAVYDFANPSEDISNVKALVENLDVGILINNVGIHQNHPQLFSELEMDKIQSLVNVNMMSVVVLTRIILPGMIHRKRGVIVNMSSTAGLQPMPYISLYSSTKTFVDHFSQSLWHEVRGDNIHVQSLVPMYIATQMTSYFPPPFTTFQCLMPSAATYAKHAVKTFGHYRCNTGYFPHTLQRGLMQISPAFINLWVGKWLGRYLEKQGKASMKKSI